MRSLLVEASGVSVRLLACPRERPVIEIWWRVTDAFESVRYSIGRGGVAAVALLAAALLGYGAYGLVAGEDVGAGSPPPLSTSPLPPQSSTQAAPAPGAPAAPGTAVPPAPPLPVTAPGPECLAAVESAEQVRATRRLPSPEAAAALSKVQASCGPGVSQIVLERLGQNPDPPPLPF